MISFVSIKKETVKIQLYLNSFMSVAMLEVEMSTYWTGKLHRPYNKQQMRSLCTNIGLYDNSILKIEKPNPILFTHLFTSLSPREISPEKKNRYNAGTKIMLSDKLSLFRSYSLYVIQREVLGRAKSPTFKSFPSVNYPIDYCGLRLWCVIITINLSIDLEQRCFKSGSKFHL